MRPPARTTEVLSEVPFEDGEQAASTATSNRRADRRFMTDGSQRFNQPAFARIELVRHDPCRGVREWSAKQILCLSAKRIQIRLQRRVPRVRLRRRNSAPFM